MGKRGKFKIWELEYTPYRVYYILMSGKNFVKRLKHDGWILDRVKGSHFIMRKGSASIAVPVHGNEDLKPGILGSLEKQAGYK
jgi:predicted RNA binding protein YcfA (HicA-like mRNA interferase family)